MSMRRKIEAVTGLAPAIAIIVCVSMALSGYTKPIYSIDDVSKKAQEPKELKTLSLSIPEKKAEKLADVKDPGAYKDGTYFGSAQGFNGSVKVKVVIKDGKIDSITVVSHTDDQPYFRNAENSIIPAIIKGQTTNVDTVSGATYSSNGIIKAVRNALAKAALSKNSRTDESAGSGEEQKPNGTNQIPKPPAEDAVKPPENYIYKDGEYTNDMKMVLCEHPRDDSWAYYLSVKVTIKDGKIASIKESKKTGKNGEYNTQNNSYLKRAFNGLGSRKGMEAKIIEMQGTADVDTVTGATISSNAIIESVNLILHDIEKIPVEQDEEGSKDDDNNEEDDTSTDTEQQSDEDDRSGKVSAADDCILHKDESAELNAEMEQDDSKEPEDEQEHVEIFDQDSESYSDRDSNC